ncbi:hypothetical protein DTO027I6_9905 [Penicillium roqueforti]|nr:hypothetical protein CBS147337_9987 [Penicillium roqueforti]KAI3184990.1 hypothetical protein DTO027I6_9905 [Penicillium roqueforti]
MQSPDRNMSMDIDISPQYCRGDYTSRNAAVSSPVVSSSGDSTADYSGVEFVLAYATSNAFDARRLPSLYRLEHPCLHHTGHPSISNGMSGHAITLNAAALACAPEIIEPNEAWSMPTASLERLLELSNTLGLRPGTLTPTQAWQHKLVELLVKEVKCKGLEQS